MIAKRQDAWTAEDDKVLAEVTLRHIREGGTQLAAFEEVAERLGRTPAACGFRWNSSVRKRYEEAIQLAKEERKKRNRERMKANIRFNPVDDASYSDSLYSLDQVIRFLRQHKHEVNDLRRQQKELERELLEREEQIKKLEQENEEMRQQLDHMKGDFKWVNDDYRTLVQIMERARKMAFLYDENTATKEKIDDN